MVTGREAIHVYMEGMQGGGDQAENLMKWRLGKRRSQRRQEEKKKENNSRIRDGKPSTHI